MKHFIALALLLVVSVAAAETQIQMRRGTASQWIAANPVLTAAEIGVDLTNNSFRVGDGVTPWVDLPEYSVTEAPEDDAVYVRENGEWAALMVEDVDLAQEVVGVLDTVNGGTGFTNLTDLWDHITALGPYPASEDLLATDLVNLYYDGVSLKVRKASAAALATQAHGFVKTNATAGDDVAVYAVSGVLMYGFSNLTVGAHYWLSETPGEITTTAPTTPGAITQRVGQAHSVGSLRFQLGDPREVP